MNAVDFGNELRRLRDGMTQQALADAIKVNRKTISRWELGDLKEPPDREKIGQIGKALQLTVEEFTILLELGGHRPKIDDSSELELVKAKILALQEEQAKLQAAALKTQTSLREIFSTTQIEEVIRPILQKLSEVERQKIELAERASYIAGDAGMVMTGDIHITNQLIDPTQPTEAGLREEYLRSLLNDCNQLDMAGIDPKAAKAEQSRIALNAVYTSLLTTEYEQSADARQVDFGREKGVQLSALTQLDRHPRLVLLGDPGSGKSTFVNFVISCLAGELLEDKTLNVALLITPLPTSSTPQTWGYRGLLPFKITLRDIVAFGLPRPRERITIDFFWRFLRHLAGQENEAQYRWQKKELTERGGLVCFDGLDEVPEANHHREQIKQLIEAVAAVIRGPILVTSRIYAYQRSEWKLHGFVEKRLAPFSAEQIKEFITRWYVYTATYKGKDTADAHGRAQLLQLNIANNPRLFELAQQPLLLTLMVGLHAWRGGSLPERREELYDESTELLLDRWEMNRVVYDSDGQEKTMQPSLQEWLKADRRAIRALLNRLAYDAHSAQKGLQGTADIPEAALVTGLYQLRQDTQINDREIIRYLRDRAGLLLPRGDGVFTFPHRTFQEYLAACYLTDTDYPTKLAELVGRDPNRWREVALLAGAKAWRGTPFALWSLVEELTPDEPSRRAPAEWQSQIAGQLVAELIEPATIKGNQKKKSTRIGRWLVHLLRNSLLPATERALAGRHLAIIGDPREEIITLEKMQFCYLPGGVFWMGETLNQTFNKRGYWLGRYPVTVAQFRQYLDIIGQEPSSDNTLNDPSSYPVRWVSWHEAQAFARWLDEYAHQQGWLTEGWQVGLPTEAEWEKGARGGLVFPSPPIIYSFIERPNSAALHTFNSIRELPNLDLQENSEEGGKNKAYPWGDGEVGERANVYESGVGNASAVGCFPQGASVYGCEEMIGNVWEWTRSTYFSDRNNSNSAESTILDSRSHQIVLRGGSWSTPSLTTDLSYTSHDHPNSQSNQIGFRLVICPR